MYDYSSVRCVSSAKVYIDKKLKRNATRAPDDLIGDILHHSCLSKKELYAAITELQIGGVETVSNIFYKDTLCLPEQFDLFRSESDEQIDTPLMRLHSIWGYSQQPASLA